MTLNEFWFKVGESFWKPENRHLRLGQMIFNLLFEIKPDLANSVRGTYCDPFYDDTKVNDLNKWLEMNWDG